MVIIQGSKGFLGVITAKMLCLQKRVFYLDALKHFKCILPQSTLQICWGGYYLYVQLGTKVWGRARSGCPKLLS